MIDDRHHSRWTARETGRLLCFRHHGWTHKQLARLLGRTPDSVKSKLRELEEMGYWTQRGSLGRSPRGWRRIIPPMSAIFLALAASSGVAAPPVGADPNSPMARWYRGLKMPGNGHSCCDVSDCRPTQARQVNGGWQALAEDGVWLDIPPQLIIEDTVHPGGSAVMCQINHTVLCFVPPAAGG